ARAGGGGSGRRKGGGTCQRGADRAAGADETAAGGEGGEARGAARGLQEFLRSSEDSRFRLRGARLEAGGIGIATEARLVSAAQTAHRALLRLLPVGQVPECQACL